MSGDESRAESKDEKNGKEGKVNLVESWQVVAEVRRGRIAQSGVCIWRRRVFERE